MMAVWIGGGLAALMLAAASPAPTASPSGPPSTVRSPQVVELLERHRHALGYMRSESATWTGIVVQNGTDQPFTESADVEGRWKATYTLPFGQRSEGNDDSKEWIQDINGNVVVRPLEHKRSLLTRMLGFNGTLLDPDISWYLDGPLTVDGRSVIRIHGKVATYDTVVYLDAHTTLVYGVEIAGRSVRYPQYQNFNGLNVPSKAIETDENRTITRTITSVTMQPFGKLDFRPPAQRRAEFPKGQSDIAVDVEEPHSLIVLNAKVNGTPLKFLLDSGSSASLIDADEARLLKLPTAGSTRVAGATILTGTEAKADALEIGGVRFAPFVFEAVPLGLPASIKGYGIAGILGYDVLAQVVTRIDYGGSRIRLISPDSFSYSGTGQVLSLDPWSRLPHVATTVGDADAATFTVDTGSDSGLIVYQEFADAHQRDFMRPGDLAPDTAIDKHGNPIPNDPAPYFGDFTQASGAGGAIRVKTAVVSRLSLGKFSVDRVFTEIVLEPSGAFTPTATDGLLGAAVLSKFGAVFLDYSGERLILER
ncbi:MAG TPA: retropepsin-like aspartic protease [Candidatus Binatus sp.]|nr:retropepsin-like aspartic protease [Candidatus Binatus sp.]